MVHGDMLNFIFDHTCGLGKLTLPIFYKFSNLCNTSKNINPKEAQLRPQLQRLNEQVFNKTYLNKSYGSM
jgi:hypothetical protein